MACFLRLGGRSSDGTSDDDSDSYSMSDENQQSDYWDTLDRHFEIAAHRSMTKAHLDR